MAHIFRLYWPRETGCELGTPLQAAALEPEIRDHVVRLAGEGDGEIALRLPFLDRREWRKRSEIMRAWRLERRGASIVCARSPAEATRDLAARLALCDAVWRGTPDERASLYFATWQRVSLALQAYLRGAIPAAYFGDVSRYRDRQAAYPILVYRVARRCYGRPRSDFTYDLGDYPADRATLLECWKLIGRSLQEELASVERRLHDAGMPSLARRYAPVWYQDVLAAVRKKPKLFVPLLTKESAIINALIDLGTQRSVASVNRFARVANHALQNVQGLDLRGLGVTVLEEATRVLRGKADAGGGDHLGDSGPLENGDLRAPGRPDLRIGNQENRDHGNSDGRGQMADTGVVSDIETSGGEPAGELI